MRLKQIFTILGIIRLLCKLYLILAPSLFKSTEEPALLGGESTLKIHRKRFFTFWYQLLMYYKSNSNRKKNLRHIHAVRGRWRQRKKRIIFRSISPVLTDN